MLLRTLRFERQFLIFLCEFCVVAVFFLLRCVQLGVEDFERRYNELSEFDRAILVIEPQLVFFLTNIRSKHAVVRPSQEYPLSLPMHQMQNTKLFVESTTSLKNERRETCRRWLCTFSL